MGEAATKTIQNIKLSLPIIIGVLLLVSFVNPLLQPWYSKIFTGNYFIDPFIGAMLGSISFGIPIVSYVTGGELLKEGVSMLAVLAFLLAWSTVGIVMFPLEAANIGKRFALWRNSLNFVAAIAIAILTVITLSLI